MKKTALTHICNFIAALCIVLLAFIVIIGAVDMPVAAEGETLTKAQELLITIKTKTTELMSALGITSSAAVLWLSTAIKKSTAASGVQLNEEVMKKLNAIEAKMQEIQAIEGTREEIAKAETEGMNALLRTFIASELPANVRQELMTAQDKLTPYVNGTKSVKESIEKKEFDILEVATKVGEMLGVFATDTAETKKATETTTETTTPTYID